MKKSILFFLLFIGATRFYSQSLDLKWSEQFIYDNKIDGFLDGYIGSNSTSIYAKFSNLALKPKKQNNKIKLLAFDKTTMKKTGEVELAGYKKKIDEDLKYHTTLVLQDVIYVIWTKRKKTAVEIYAQTFDPKLKKVNKLSKIYELYNGKKETDNLILSINKKYGNKLLIGKEFAITKDEEDLRIEYKILNPDFTVANSKQVTLPIVITKRRRGMFVNYTGMFAGTIAQYNLEEDGNIYIQDMIRLSDDEIKSLRKSESAVYSHQIQIKTESGEMNEYRIKFPSKNTFNASTIITSKGIKLYGFFSDLDKDIKGHDTHGIFYVSLDPETFKPIETKFSYFDKEFLNVLFEADKENQKKGKGLFKSKKAKESDDNSLDDNYIIEYAVADGTDMVLFCSMMRNWQQTVCTTNSNGGTTCTTYYYCTKSNVTAFKLNSAGDIVWAKNMDRLITYNRWNVYDLNVIKSGNDYYVTYGSAFEINAKKKNRRSSKSKSEMRDRFEYAVFSGRNGDYKKAEYQVNGFNTKKKEMKYVSPANIAVYDNRMYTSCVRTKLKAKTFIACLCPPVFYFMLFSGNSKKGTGYLGTISPINK